MALSVGLRLNERRGGGTAFGFGEIGSSGVRCHVEIARPLAASAPSASPLRTQWGGWISIGWSDGEIVRCEAARAVAVSGSRPDG